MTSPKLTRPCCVLCARQAGILDAWRRADGLNPRGTCHHCRFISATVQMSLLTLVRP